MAPHEQYGDMIRFSSVVFLHSSFTPVGIRHWASTDIALSCKWVTHQFWVHYPFNWVVIQSVWICQPAVDVVSRELVGRLKSCVCERIQYAGVSLPSGWPHRNRWTHARKHTRRPDGDILGSHLDTFNALIPLCLGVFFFFSPLLVSFVNSC